MVGEQKLKRTAWTVLLITLVITSFLGYNIKNVRFDYDFEKFFPIEDDETSFFFEYRKQFESDNDFLLIAIENGDGILSKPFLNKISALTDTIAGIPLVEQVTSITNQEQIIILPNGFVATNPYFKKNDFQLERDSLRIYNSKELINTLVSKDGKAVCLFIKHEEFISKKKSDQLVKEINAALSPYSFDRVCVAGRTVGQAYYIKKMNFELILFVSLSAFLIVIFLFIAFRSAWGIIIPQVIILGTITWLVGFLGLFDKPINIILTTMPSVMFVVGMSDVIHLVSRYLDARREDQEKLSAIYTAIREVGLATLLTSVTTAIGFFSLLFVNVDPIRDYGLVIGFGVLIAFMLTFILLPILFYLFPGPKYIEKQKEGHFWQKYLRLWFVSILKKRKRVLVISGLVLIVSIGGVLNLESNNYLMDDIKESEQTKKDFNYLDAKFGGIRPFEMAIIIKDTTKNIWDIEVLREVEKVENYIEETYGAEIKQSINQTLKVVNRSSHSGNPDYYSLPESQRKVNSYKRKIKMAAGGKIISSLVDSTQRMARISGGLGDLGNQVITEKNNQLTSYLETLDSKDWLTFKLTGTAHLLDKNMNYLASSLVRGLLVSIGIVALIMGIIYRSASILIISIVPNLLPLVVVAGFMGYYGIDLKTSTAIIFTIGFGIAVDDTIHFLGKFKHELLKGKSKIYALKRSYLTTGKAMILTSLILCSGFLLLMLSSFLGTFYMGMLLCLTLIIALILDLTLLPILLLLFYKPKK